VRPSGFAELAAYFDSLGGSVTTTLLGVDDSKTMRRVLEITFAGEDYKTVLAANADDAMTKLHAERPSVVLLDAALEGTNGYDLCQRLKAAVPSVAVVLLASKQQPYDRARGTQAGADDFMDKPFDTQQLLDKVGTLLKRAPGAAATNLTSTQHGLGAPAPAPVGVPLTAAARPISPELGARGRTQTLAYGHNPMGGAGPVAPVIPAPTSAGAGPAPAPTPRSSPVAAAPPFPPPSPPAKPNFTPAPSPVAAAPVPATPVASPAAAAMNGADFSQKLAAIGLTKEQVTAVLALSREVVERVVWEVVPTLAETMIREEITRLTRD